MKRLAVIVALIVIGYPFLAAQPPRTTITSGSTLPTNCTADANIYGKTGSNAGFYFCTASNTWTAVAPTGNSLPAGGDVLLSVSGTSIGGTSDLVLSSDTQLRVNTVLADADFFSAALHSSHLVRIGMDDATGNGGALNIEASVAGSFGAPQILFYATRGTMASPTATADGDTLLLLNANGFDGTTTTFAGGIAIVQIGNPANNNSETVVQLNANDTSGTFHQLVVHGVDGMVNVEQLTSAGTIKGGGYKSSDGSPGITGATCSAWKNGLCTSA